MPAAKRIIVILLLIVLSFFSFTSLSFGKTPLENAQDDYTFQFTKYQDAKAKYLQDKATYEKFKTATSKNNAYLSTKDYLTQVDNLYSTYLQLIIEKGNEIDWTNNQDKRDKTVSLINDEIFFINDHKERITKAQTLEDLPPLAADLTNRITSQILPKLYKVLSLYEIVEAKSILLTLDSTTAEVENYISKNPFSNQSVLANWKSEIGNIRDSANLNVQNAEKSLTKTDENSAKDKDLENISAYANSAKASIKKSKKLFEEILRLL